MATGGDHFVHWRHRPVDCVSPPMTEQQLNFFEQVADRQMTAPAKAKQRAVDKRRDRGPPPLSAQDRKLREQSMQLRRARYERRQQLKEQYNGKHQDGWRELQKALRLLSLEDSEKILDHVRKADWLLGADPD